MENKNGRKRNYTFARQNAAPDPEVAVQLDYIHELALRVADQVEHLPKEAFNYVAVNTQLSVGRLVLHLIGNDLKMMAMLSGSKLDTDFMTRISAGNLDNFSVPPGDIFFAKDIIKEHVLTRRAESDRVVQAVKSLDQPIDTHPKLKVARELIFHMGWHWTYHSGHIGLLAQEAGYDYTWVM